MFTEDELLHYLDSDEQNTLSETEKAMFFKFSAALDEFFENEVDLAGEYEYDKNTADEEMLLFNNLKNGKEDLLDLTDSLDFRLLEIGEYKIVCDEKSENCENNFGNKSNEKETDQLQKLDWDPSIVFNEIIANEPETSTNDNEPVNYEGQYNCSNSKNHLTLENTQNLQLYEFESNQQLNDSANTNNQQKKVPRKRTFRCDICRKGYKENYQLNPNNLVDSEEKRFNCIHCDYNSNYKDCIVRHFKNKECKADKEYACTQCESKGSRKKTGLNDDKKHKCLKCDYQTNHKGTMDRHLLMHEGARPYLCNLCNKRFRLRKDLKVHNSIHSDDKRFHCGHCDYKCIQKRYLILHIKDKHILNKEKDYKCSECSYQTNIKSSMKEHMQNTHSEVRAHVCDICGKSFKSHSNYKNHILTHSEDKRFCCPHCEYKTTRKICLVIHLKNRHCKFNGEEYRCSECPYETSVGCDLNTHIKVHIPVNNHRQLKCAELLTQQQPNAV